MGINCGIVGLPNVGKSTLFNALTQTIAAEAANYPFCTIEPNVGLVGVPDYRLDELAKIAGSQTIIPTQIEFVDIAGLVEGANKGEGLGNQFLGHIRQVDAIIHVLRCFDDDDITHVNNKVDPIRDAEIVETELMLADIQSLEKQIVSLDKKARGNDKEAKEKITAAKELLELINNGKPARIYKNLEMIKSFNLLTSKPILYVCNVDEASCIKGNNYSDMVKEKAAKENAGYVIISSKIESEIANLDTHEEKIEFLSTLGLKEAGLNKLIKEGYKLLGLLTFFTVGPKEARAWTVINGATAQEAAGVIHTDFAKGFIRAETIAYQDYIEYKGEQGAKDNGKLRLEGKEYLVQDGDVFHFRFNV